jgi:hypothetical protein
VTDQKEIAVNQSRDFVTKAFVTGALVVVPTYLATLGGVPLAGRIRVSAMRAWPGRIA